MTESTSNLLRLKGLVVLLLTCLGASLWGAVETPVTVAARRLTTPIKIDGIPDEPAWQQAGIIPQLTQQEPHPGQPTSFQTEILMGSDEENLYIALICHDPDPARIVVHTMQRDGNMSGDQTVALVFDTFGDHRLGYYFEINRAGARLDGLISGAGDVSNDWDGVWDAKTHRTVDGWTAEIRLPAQTLRFTPGAASWGFNVQRRIARKRLTLRWTGTTLDAQFTDLRRAGLLSGVAKLRQGKGLSVSPFGLVRRIADLQQPETAVSGAGGLDIMYNITSDLSAVVTFSSDFSETEVDNRQVNLTRFPLFFPEKRAFFVEGSNLFSFGSGLGEDFIPFFSRRIGLYNGSQVPLNGGFKVLGRVGRWSVAALDARMGSSSATQSTNLFAGRVTTDVSDHFTFGTMITSGDPDGVHHNSLAGMDALWRTSTFHKHKNLALGGWFAFAGGDLPAGSPGGWGLKLDYPNDLWDLFFTYKAFGAGLDPALGFLPRPGTRWYQGGGAFQPRPAGPLLGWVRQFYFEMYATYVANLSGQTESWRLFMAPFNAQTVTGEHIEFNVVPQFEHLATPFEIADSVVIPVGDYQFTRFRLEAQSSRHWAWRVGSTVWFGAFYTGSLTQVESFITYTLLQGHLQLEVQHENDFTTLAEGDFTQRLWQVTAAYALTPDLIFSSYTQYDSESRNMGSNSRLRWTIRPGNDLFLVWNHGWEYPLGSRSALNLQPVSDQLVAKVRWTFRR